MKNLLKKLFKTPSEKEIIKLKKEISAQENYIQRMRELYGLERIWVDEKDIELIKEMHRYEWKDLQTLVIGYKLNNSNEAHKVNVLWPKKDAVPSEQDMIKWLGHENHAYKVTILSYMLHNYASPQVDDFSLCLFMKDSGRYYGLFSRAVHAYRSILPAKEKIQKLEERIKQLQGE